MVGVDAADLLGIGVSSLLRSLSLSLSNGGKEEGGRDFARSGSDEGARSCDAFDAEDVRRGKGGGGTETGAGVFSRSFSSLFFGGGTGGGDAVSLPVVGRGEDTADMTERLEEEISEECERASK